MLGESKERRLSGVQLGSQSLFESQNPNFTCRILLICQGSIKAQGKRCGKQMRKMLLHYVVRCFGGDGAGEVPAVPYVLFWPQIKTNRCRSVNWKGRASRSAPRFRRQSEQGPLLRRLLPGHSKSIQELFSSLQKEICSISHPCISLINAVNQGRMAH